MKNRRPVIIGTVTLVVVALIAAVVYAAFPYIQARFTPVSVVDATGYANPTALVDTAWVQANLDNDNVVFIDTSSAENYLVGHLPGAINLNIRTDLVDPEDPFGSKVITQDGLSALFSRLGIENDDTVVLYDGDRNLFAARAFWALKYYRHQDVRLYNGGSVRWVAEGNTLAVEQPTLTATEYVAAEPDPAIRTDWEYVVNAIDDPATLTCDARSEGEYTGEDVRNGSGQGGRVPDAVNVDWVNAINADGTFKSAEELRALYEGAGFTPDREILIYCQTGVRSAHTWFVLTQLLGYPSVRNYDGSWIEYSNLDDVPVESGDAA